MINTEVRKDKPVSVPTRKKGRSTVSSGRLSAATFLLPNFMGFLVFTLFPVLLSLWMAFTNWTLKPAVAREFLGLRNFNDLLGVRALDRPQPGLAVAFIFLVALLCAGLFGVLWANVSQWRGVKVGGIVLTLLGLAGVIQGVFFGADQGILIAGLVFTVAGIGALLREEGGWKIGIGTLPAVILTVACVGLWIMSGPMWRVYEPRDTRFWQFFYNTIYLMMGIPFSIAGALSLALLLSEELSFESVRMRIAGALICIGCGVVTLLLVWGMGNPNVALLGLIFWVIAALGIAFNVVAFRTIFYLPTFTAGVALMILWKALYNPETGPINVGLEAMFATFGWAIEPPQWLADVEWAKPALIIMGIWTGIGGTNMLLYLAGLSNVPKELLDAAEVDGAGVWSRFRHVTWPQLAPTTFFICVMAIIGGLQGGFEQARVMTGGGPAGSTTTLSYYIYNKAFQDLDLGYAAAISWVLFSIIFVATAINWKFGREVEVEG